MTATFNDLLKAAGIDPKTVSLLRHHTDKGGRGRTPYTLWRDDLHAFELYQCTQQDRPVFRTASYWAAFVSSEKYETLFVGLYAVKLDKSQVIHWLDPLTGRPVGHGKSVPYYAFYSQRQVALEEQIGRLQIDWDVRKVRSWAQYAHRNNKMIVQRAQVLVPPEGSWEGRRIWVDQSKIERQPNLSLGAKNLNRARYGRVTCEACKFTNRDEGLFEAHHPCPLALGERQTRVEDLIVLCPTCHRRAHRKGQLDPYSLPELREWVAAGRP